MAKAILRLPACSKKVGYKRSAIYEKFNPQSPRYDPSFPKPISLGARAIGFLESELDEWIDSRVRECRKADGKGKTPC